MNANGIVSQEEQALKQLKHLIQADPEALARDLTKEIALVRGSAVKDLDANHVFVQRLQYELDRNLGDETNPDLEEISTSMGKAYAAYLLMKDSPMINKEESAQIMSGIIYLASMGIIHLGQGGVSIPVVSHAWRTLTALRQVLVDLRQLKEELTPKVVIPSHYTPLNMGQFRRTATEAQQVAMSQNATLSSVTGMYQQMLGQLFNKNSDENKTPGSP